MDKGQQRERAERFRALHQGPRILVLGSVWDVASAVVFARAGFAALGTSSAGVAYSLGYADGEVIPLEEMLGAVRRIATRVDIPVSADMEMGYGTSAESVATTCRAVLDAGAIGINIEDATGDAASPLVDPRRQAETIRAIRRMAGEYGVPLVINARTDGYWLKIGDGAARFADTVRRANLYREAGADCLFVPGAVDRGVVRALVKEIHGPLNVLATPGCQPVAELEQLGVARVSQGSGPSRAALGVAGRIAAELLTQGTYSGFHSGSLSYADANALFAQ